MLAHAHMIRGMGVEVAGAEHVATAGFDVAGGHIEVGFGSFLLRGRTEIDEASGKRKERKQERTRHTFHLTLQKKCDRKGPTGNISSLLSCLGRFKNPIRNLAVRHGAHGQERSFSSSGWAWNSGGGGCAHITTWRRGAGAHSLAGSSRRWRL